MADDTFISIIIPSYNSRETIERCLLSLKDQIDPKGLTNEVIVVDSSNDGTGDLVAASFPWVRLIRFPERILDGNARNVGVLRSQGNILAFIDADCVADSNWLSEIRLAHRAESPAIGGVIAHANPDSYVGWANYFCEFSQWMPQRHTTFMTDIPSACYSVKRWAFEKYGPFLEDIYCSDTAFNWRLERQGHKALFVPAIRVNHLSLYSFRSLLIKKFWHGRNFAQVRVAEQRLNVAKRFLLAAGLPVLPFLLFFRRAGFVRQHGPYLAPFIQAAPLIWLALAAWSLGEFMGYWAGASASVQNFPVVAPTPVVAE